MSHFISAMVIGIGCLYLLYHVAVVLYFLAFGDDGFTWWGLKDVAISVAILTALGFSAWVIGNVILSVL